MFSNPQLNLEQFGLGKGMKVADLGVGAGFYVISAARMVGEDGRIYAIDIQKELVAEVKRVAKKEGLNNVEAIWGDLEKEQGTRLKDAQMDACILSNVLFQAEDKKTLIKEVMRILRPGGKVLCVDWTGSFAGMGPSKDLVVNEEVATSLFKDAGFTIGKKINAGDHHYGFVALKT